MKYSMIYTTIFFVLFIAINSQDLKSDKNSTESESEYKTFLVKTQLTKQELETLLKEEETKLVNLKKKEIIIELLLLMNYLTQLM